MMFEVTYAESAPTTKTKTTYKLVKQGQGSSGISGADAKAKARQNAGAGTLTEVSTEQVPASTQSGETTIGTPVEYYNPNTWPPGTTYFNTTYYYERNYYIVS